MDRIKAMKSVPMFSVLDGRAIDRLLTDCRPLNLPAGAMVFGPAQEADRFFVVLSGRVKIYKVSARGDEQILHLFGPGETFGEAAMWTGAGYPAWAEALEPTELAAITRASLKKAIAASPDVAMGMMAGLSAKLREFNQLIEDLSLKEVPARIAGVLLKEARWTKTSRVVLKQTKRQLAAQIGTIAETLSRALGRMKADGLIDVQGSRIEILDMARLEDLAENG